MQDLDYMAQQLLQEGVLPQQFYNSSFSEMEDALNAKSRKDRVQDPFELARKIGAI